MLRQITSEPRINQPDEQKLSPRDRSIHNKSVIVNDEVAKKTFKDVVRRTEDRLRKKTRSTIRQQFDQDRDHEKKTEK